MKSDRRSFISKMKNVTRMEMPRSMDQVREELVYNGTVIAISDTHAAYSIAEFDEGKHSGCCWV